MMKNKVLLLAIVTCLVITQCATIGKRDSCSLPSPSRAHSIADTPVFSSTRNETITVGDRTITFVGHNMTTLFDFRPQLSDDPLLEDIISSDREAIFYFLGANDTILLCGFNQSMFVEIVLNLTSQYGPISSSWVHTDDGFACNLTEVLARTLDELDARHHMLIDDIVHVALWSGQNGLPTFDGPNNYYIGNAAFDEVHWEVYFKTNATQQSVYDQQEYEVYANAMMYFSADGSLLDFHIVHVPFDDSSPIPWTLIMISGIAVVCIGLVVARGRRQYR